MAHIGKKVSLCNICLFCRFPGFLGFPQCTFQFSNVSQYDQGTYFASLSIIDVRFIHIVEFRPVRTVIVKHDNDIVHFLNQQISGNRYDIQQLVIEKYIRKQGSRNQ